MPGLALVYSEDTEDHGRGTEDAPPAGASWGAALSRLSALCGLLSYFPRRGFAYLAPAVVCKFL